MSFGLNIFSLYRYGMICTLSTLSGDIMSQIFTNQATVQNIDAMPNILYGSGLSFYDFDNDGWDDLSFTMNSDSCIFYKNNEGNFIQTPSFVYGDSLTRHVLWVDYDNDSDNDLFISSSFAPYRLFQNDGNFNFTDVSIVAGLSQSNERHYGASFTDYNRDGFLDLYVCTYEYEGNETFYNRLNHLYRNNGNGTFTDVTPQAGVGDGIKMSFQGVWLDYDLDGWPDLFVINDRYSPNSFYRNNGDGTFTDVTESTGTAFTLDDPMSATVGDFDNDGDMDIYMSNSAILSNQPCRLLENNNNGTFTDVAVSHGINFSIWTWGALWIDYNNDTFQDLYVTTSTPIGPVIDNLFFISNEAGEFLDGEGIFEGNHAARSYVPASGDINNDGFYDIAVHNRAPYQPFLWQNSGETNNYIKISLQGTLSNRSAIGSWIRVYAGGNKYTKYTMCGENYLGQNSQHHIFGLGSYTVVDSVEIEYNRGHKDKYYNLGINQRYYFTEGETYSAALPYVDNSLFCQGDSLILDAGEHFSYLWNTGDTGRYLTVMESGIYSFIGTNEYQIEAFSDTLTVQVNPTPIISYVSENPLCDGENNGSILIDNLTGVETENISWSNGANEVILDSLVAGSYTYFYTDINSCTVEGTIDLVSPILLDVQVFVSPEINGNDGAINLIINGGTPPYFVFLNSEEESSNILDLAAGPYFLQVLDNNSCAFSSGVEIPDQTSGILDRAASHIKFYPNPTTDIFQLITDHRIRELKIFTINGKLLYRISAQNLQTFAIGDFVPGMYLIELMTKEGTPLYGKIIKE